MQSTTSWLTGVSAALVLCAATATASAQDAGKEAFLSNNCNRCHAIESEGIEATVKSKRMRGPDLSTIGEDRDAAWLVDYIQKEARANDREHPVAWKGSDDELKAMAEWLASLE
jgi:mono/diheme cytochrome c family protein